LRESGVGLEHFRSLFRSAIAAGNRWCAHEPCRKGPLYGQYRNRAFRELR
jgi:hypothetical protein